MVAKLVLQYDGGAFMGWSPQPGCRTVSAELARALHTILREDVFLTVAGRTDRGVHALGQVVSYEGRLPALRSLNAVLPADVAVIDAAVMPPGFSARHDAVSRAYVYRLLARRPPSPFEQGRALWWPHAVDEPALVACAEMLVGRHDFTAFTPSETQHRRFDREVVAASWERHGDILEFRIEADSFMRHMIRILVGTMLEVASRRRTVADFARLLEGRPRSHAGATAPGHGLYLAAVRY
jgi:tRNA pseudouridine38-40 synthase